MVVCILNNTFVSKLNRDTDLKYFILLIQVDGYHLYSFKENGLSARCAFPNLEPLRQNIKELRDTCLENLRLFLL